MDNMTLREVCELVGVTRRAVQGYERVEMVRATGKNKYGYLLYDMHAVERIKRIKMYRDMGFSLKETKLLLDTSKDVRRKMLCQKVDDIRKEMENLAGQISIIEEMIIDCT